MKRRNLLQLAAASISASTCGFALHRDAYAQSQNSSGKTSSIEADLPMDGSAPSSPPTVQIGNLVIGTGQPKIVIPITGASAEEAMKMANQIGGNKNGDLAEFRIDYLKGPLDPQEIAGLCANLRTALDGKPLLATFRTRKEGGQREISAALYEALYEAILKNRASELLDIEMMTEAPVCERLMALARRQKVSVIVSNHNFDDTPASGILLDRLKRQQAMGADILKMAVMPKSPGDTIRLMQVSWEMYSRFAHRPLLTMAMGGEGVVSRLSGELTGSSMTYGSLGAASAPGQLNVEELAQVLRVINKAGKA